MTEDTLKNLFIYFLERGGGREKERKRNIDAREKCGLVISRVPWLRTKPTTQACALTGNQTGGLSLCGTMPYKLSHSWPGKDTLNSKGFRGFIPGIKDKDYLYFLYHIPKPSFISDSPIYFGTYRGRGENVKKRSGSYFSCYIGVFNRDIFHNNLVRIFFTFIKK